MIPSVTSSTYIPAFETQLKDRVLSIQLNEIKELLDIYGTNDFLSQSIEIWYDQFKLALQLRVSEQDILTGFVELLKSILMDPCLDADIPLDEEAVIGDDNQVYNSQLLILARHHSGGLELPMTYTPHPLARFMVDWLKRHNAYTHNLAVVEAYEEIRNLTLPQAAAAACETVAPSYLNDYLDDDDEETDPAVIEAQYQQFLLERAEQERIVHDEQKSVHKFSNETIATFKENQAQAIKKQFTLLSESLKQSAARTEDRVLKSRVATQADYDKAVQKIEAAEIEIKASEVRCDEIKATLADTKCKLSDAERESLRLKLLIEETKRKLDDSDKKRKKSILVEIIVGVACIVISYYLPPAVGLYVKTGGVMLGIAIPTSAAANNESDKKKPNNRQPNNRQ